MISEEWVGPRPAQQPDLSNTFRRAMKLVATPVAIVTTTENKTPVGLTVGSFTCVSLDPMLVTFFIDESSTTWPRMKRSPTFAVNILAHGDGELCRSFSRKVDRFAGVAWSPSSSGDPLLQRAAVTLECRSYCVQPLGDHTQVVGEVSAVDFQPNALPLVFFQSSFLDLTR